MIFNRVISFGVFHRLRELAFSIYLIDACDHSPNITLIHRRITSISNRHCGFPVVGSNNGSELTWYSVLILRFKAGFCIEIGGVVSTSWQVKVWGRILELLNGKPIWFPSSLIHTRSITRLYRVPNFFELALLKYWHPDEIIKFADSL